MVMSKHQTLMTRAYKKWANGMTYLDFLQALNVTERRAVTLGNLNYQVGNGGFLQWADNRYIQGLEHLREALTAVGTPAAVKVLAIVNQAAETYERNETKLRRWVDTDDAEDDTFECLDEFDSAFNEVSAQLLRDSDNFFRQKQAA